MALTRPPVDIGAHGGATSSMSAFWLVPQLMFAGLTEIFGSIGQNEFFYKEFPENMRSIAGSVFYFGVALSSYLNGFLISMVHHYTLKSPGGEWLPEDLNKGKLDYFYYLTTALGLLNFGYFLLVSRWYEYKGTDDAVADSVSEVSMGDIRQN